MSYILGIDPGVTGAYVILSKKKKRIKVCKLFTSFEEVLEDITPYLRKLVACVEKVSGNRAMSPKAMTTFLKNAGAWEGFLIALKIPYTFASPSVWPKKIFDVQPPRKTTVGVNPKQLRRAQAENRKIKKLHTTSFVLRTLPKSKKYLKLKKDQDKADAICIALYKRKQMGYND